MEWVYGRTIAQNSNEDIPQLFKNISHLLSREISASANMGALCNKAVDLIYDFVTPQSDFWDSIKGATNEFVKGLLPQAEAFINQSKTVQGKFQRACALAATGNVSPLGAPLAGKAFAFPEAIGIMDGTGRLPTFVGDAYAAVRQSQRVLYVTDNAGEIGFDTLLVSRLKDMGKNVTVVVKEPSFFEDATLADAIFFNLNSIADRIVAVNKVFVPGKDRSTVDRAFRQSDLIISKGTGNFEALFGETKGKSALYLLKIKCESVSRLTNIREGRFVVILDK